ncbi:hypothetical protein [Afifella pfennigii]|uniref:hypothetical protein n=1 Tax=Afifella pfennigii TaxID=209897 RepID=UPI00068B28A5|nr:hypothetical protein [Afifella pfennigii]
MEIVRLWAPIAIAAAVFLWNIVQYRAGARKAELDELREDLKELDGKFEEEKKAGNDSRSAVATRLTAIEGEFKHMPDAASANRTEMALVEVRGQLAVLNERLQPVAAISERLQEFLLEEAKEKRGRT